MCSTAASASCPKGTGHCPALMRKQNKTSRRLGAGGVPGTPRWVPRQELFLESPWRPRAPCPLRRPLGWTLDPTSLGCSSSSLGCVTKPPTEPTCLWGTERGWGFWWPCTLRRLALCRLRPHETVSGIRPAWGWMGTETELGLTVAGTGLCACGVSSDFRGPAGVPSGLAAMPARVPEGPVAGRPCPAQAARQPRRRGGHMAGARAMAAASLARPGGPDEEPAPPRCPRGPWGPSGSGG